MISNHIINTGNNVGTINLSSSANFGETIALGGLKISMSGKLNGLHTFSVDDLVICLVEGHNDFGKIGKIKVAKEAQLDFDIDPSTRLISNPRVMPTYQVDFSDDGAKPLSTAGSTVSTLGGNNVWVQTGGTITFTAPYTHLREDEIQLAFSV